MTRLSSLDRKVLPVVAGWWHRGRGVTEERASSMPDPHRLARIGAVVCTALVVAGVLIAVLAGGGSSSEPAARVSPGVNHTATVGLAAGGDLAGYVAGRKAQLAALPASADVPAMVSLVTYVAPQAAATTLLRDYRVSRALYRLSSVSPPQQSDVRDLATDGPRIINCSCLYAVVVRAPADRLRALAKSPYVRLVDAAPAGTTFLTPASTALLPERQS